VVVLAQQEARANKQGYIGCEHILVGLRAEEEGLAARVLEGLKIDLPGIKQSALARSEGRLREDEEVSGQIPFTPRARKSLELALREALSLGHNYIGTEHILLGLLRDPESAAVAILQEDFMLPAEKVRSEVVRMLSGPKAPILKRDKESTPLVVEQEKLDAKAQSARSLLQGLKHDTEQVFSRSVAIKLMVEAIEQGRQYPYRKAEKIAQGVLVMDDKD
jgi:ATP-dependent Clp protease ATP-binding subunit ClpA